MMTMRMPTMVKCASRLDRVSLAVLEADSHGEGASASGPRRRPKNRKPLGRGGVPSDALSGALRIGVCLLGEVLIGAGTAVARRRGTEYLFRFRLGKAPQAPR